MPGSINEKKKNKEIMKNFRLGVKYCGGCRPQYDRRDLVRMIGNFFPEIELGRMDSAGQYDAVLIVNGCSAKCADTDCIPRNIPWIVIDPGRKYVEAVEMVKKEWMNFLRKGERMMFEYKNIHVEIKEKKGIITVERPKVLNAVDWETFHELQDAMNVLIKDDEVRVIILTGAGKKSFISGGDVGEELKMNGLTSYRWSLTGHKFCATIENSPKPVIAAVNGYCLGGGFEFALACDFRIASENAKFGAPESNLGVCCGFGGNIRLPRIVGKAWAKDILMTGRMVSADEAYRLNLVTKVVPLDDLMDAVDELCEKLVNKSANVLDFIKKATDYGSEMDLRSAAQFESGLFGVISGTYDKKEGMGAFMEKREPKFKDR